MYPQSHFLFPFFLGLILTKFNVISCKMALLAGIIGIIIDLDHYIEHILHAKKNKFSLKDTWNNSVKLHKFEQRSFIHHWQGALVLTFIFLVLLFFNWQITLVLAIGYYSHLLLDYVHFKREKYLRFKIGRLLVKESYTELTFDIILVILIIVLLI